MGRLSLIYHLRVFITGHITLIGGLYSADKSLFGPHQVTWQAIIPFPNLVLCIYSLIHIDWFICEFFFTNVVVRRNNISFVEENVFMNTSSDELRINDNKITHLPELKATRLNILVTRRNLLSEVGFLRLLPALTSVRLDENPFPPTKSLMIGATQLKTLECTQTVIEKMPVISAAKSSMLRTSMDRNNIKCIGFVHLSNMTLLKVLEFVQNSIRRFPDPGCASSYSSTYASGDWQFPHLNFFSMRDNGLIEFPLLPGMGTSATCAQTYVSRNEITNRHTFGNTEILTLRETK